MKKSSGRVFYLSIAVIGIFITVVSVLSIFYQSVPPVVERLLTVDHLFASLPEKAVSLGGTAQTLARTSEKGQSTSTAKDQGSATGDSRAAGQLKKIHVETFGSGGSGKEITRVQTILQKAKSMDQISQTLKLSLKDPVTIRLVNNAAEYDTALKNLGLNANDALNLSKSSGGFTQNDTVLIPLNQNQNDTDLANTLTHELTHVYLNQNIGPLPSWLNEGIAVYMGMNGQKQIESAATFAGYQRQLAENILDVVASKQLQPLSSNENVILSGQASYDYELQDWLALSDLVAQHGGVTALRRFLELLRHHADESQAFIVAFGLTQDVFDKQFTNLLTDAVSPQDAGVQFTLSIDNQFQGNVEFLQHGANTWRGLVGTAGYLQVTMSPSGALHGNFTSASSVPDQNPADQHTVYISLMPSRPLSFNGQKVTDCGFALDTHHGLYAFENAWITFASGQTIYQSTPTLFGVTVQSIDETNHSNPLLAVFQA